MINYFFNSKWSTITQQGTGNLLTINQINSRINLIYYWMRSCILIIDNISVVTVYKLGAFVKCNEIQKVVMDSWLRYDESMVCRIVVCSVCWVMKQWYMNRQCMIITALFCFINYKFVTLCVSVPNNLCALNYVYFNFTSKIILLFTNLFHNFK